MECFGNEVSETRIRAIFGVALLILILGIALYQSNLGGAPFSERVPQFSIRIADFMPMLRPDFDSSSYANNWQRALDDLKQASPNGEITHVQLRLFWHVYPLNRSTWEYPELGAHDGGSQQAIMENWQSWIFGSPPPTFSPSAAERIHNAGFNLEICLATAWYSAEGLGAIADAIPSVFGDGGREANAPEYPFDGELFLQNYMDNCLRPLAQFLAASPNFQNGDIFMIGFEMGYSTSDFVWSHNKRWLSMIKEVRQIFDNAGKQDILLTFDHSGWYNDAGLGHDAVALLSDNPPSTPGISGAKYLAALDFISISFWIRHLRESEVPTTWSDSDIDWVVNKAWYNCSRWFKAGTGHDGVSGVFGRNLIADFAALSQVMNNKKILLNTGWENGHYTLVSWYAGEYDDQAQRVAWMAQIRALGNNEWCAGQDFERYVADKSATVRVDASWRNSPAQDGIITEIRRTLNNING